MTICKKCDKGFVVKELNDTSEMYWLSKKYKLYYLADCDCCNGNYENCETCKIDEQIQEDVEKRKRKKK